MNDFFKLFIPQKVDSSASLFCLVFSSEIRKINHEVVLNGLYETTVADALNGFLIEKLSNHPFQFLLILDTKEGTWVSNCYSMGSEFQQGPWVFTKLIQTQKAFEIICRMEDSLQSKYFTSEFISEC